MAGSRGWEGMRRRNFIKVIGSTVAWPLVARAQQADRKRRIGVLTSFVENDAWVQRCLAAFQKRLNEASWQNGRNIEINTRWGAAEVEMMQRSAKELVAFQPDLILTISARPTAATLQQTRTIPIIFVAVTDDPVGSGFVANLNRPGGNVTGFMNMEPAMAGKWVELLKEIAPRITRVAFLFNPALHSASDSLKHFKAAAAALSVEPITAPFQKMSEVETIFADQGREPNGGLVVMPDALLFAHRAEIASLAARYRLPAVYSWRDSVESGGLLSYGNDRIDHCGRAAIYADRILRGEKPGDLPVQAPVKFELIINRKTAELLGLTIPTSLLVAANEIIE
jgi:putative tryptophan/tyrosine transport system substrate-binding protein